MSRIDHGVQRIVGDNSWGQMMHPLQRFSLSRHQDCTFLSNLRSEGPSAVRLASVPSDRVVQQNLNQRDVPRLGEHAVQGIGPNLRTSNGEHGAVMPLVQRSQVQTFALSQRAVMQFMALLHDLLFACIRKQRLGHNRGGFPPLRMDHLRSSADLISKRPKHFRHHVRS